MRFMLVVFIAGAITVCASACNNAGFKGSASKYAPEIDKDFSQDTYPVATTSVVQGVTRAPTTETFDQGQWGALDILVVIDNSGSMKEEQANLANKLAPLLSQVDKADWQIGVVTTDPADPCMRALIRKGDANAAQTFSDAVNAGTNGTGTERPILQAVTGLSCAHPSWVRPNSTVAILLVTDEDNCHIENGVYGCQNDPDLDGSYLTNYLSSIRTLGKDAKVYGIYWDPSQPQTSCPTAFAPAKTLATVVKATGGTSGSICDSDYTPTLTAISNDVAQILSYQFTLAHVPNPGTLKVLVDGSDWQQYTLAGQTVRFTVPPAFGAKVAVTYNYGADGDARSSFPLDHAPIADSIQVAINGQAAAADSYNWNSNTGQVDFKTPPADRAQITMTYKEATPLRATFTIDRNADPASLTVTVNGQRAADVVYDSATGTLTFATPPPEGAKVHASYHLK